MWMWTREKETGRDVADTTWREDVSKQLADIAKTVMQLALSVESLKSGMMSRAEIEAADAKRVSTETFTATMEAIYQRIERLENASARVLAWVAVAVSILSVLLNVYVSLKH